MAMPTSVTVRFLRAAMATVVGGGSLAAQGTPPALQLSGQVRLRGEWDGRTAATGDDAAVLSRVRVGITSRFQPWLSAVIQLQDARAWGSEADPADASADQLDVHQGYLELVRGRTILRVGRQEVALGDERLVGASAWSNTGRAMDGALLRRDFRSGHVRLFWMNVGERDALLPGGLSPQLNQGADTDGWFLGAHVTRAAGSATLEGMLLHDRNAVTDRSWTAQGRAHGATPSGRFQYDASAAYQFGSDRAAYLVSALLGVRVAETGRVAGQVDVLSGDDSPLDGRRRAFQSLYPSPHPFHGFMDYFLVFPAHTAGRGLVDASVRALLPVRADWTLRGAAHHFALEKGAQGRSLGVEIDVAASRPLAAGVALDVGASLFDPGEAMEFVSPAFTAGTGSTTYWGYVMLTVGW